MRRSANGWDLKRWSSSIEEKMELRSSVRRVKIEDPDEKSRVCETILRSLPPWFGIESAILDYIRHVRTMETWVAMETQAIGFISLHKHNPHTAEIHVMGLLPEFHGKQIGSDLVRAAEESLLSQGFRFLTVKTLAESCPDVNYDKTRRFYLKCGFIPLEEFKTLWDESNPCLMMVKALSASQHPVLFSSKKDGKDPEGPGKGQRMKSKSGADVVIRSAVKQDAAALLELSKGVIEEEIYQLTSGSEFKMTVEDEEKWIESHLANPNHLLLVAEINSRIVGVLDFSNGHRQRIAHTGEFGLSVEKGARGQGIGLLLMQGLIEWATQNPTIEKIGLYVHGNNDRAIALYKKMGFEIEGLRRRELKYGEGQYVDTIIMSRFV